jgi:hypothetical protein
LKSNRSNQKQAELGEVSEEYTASIIRVEEQSKQVASKMDAFFWLGYSSSTLKMEAVRSSETSMNYRLHATISVACRRELRSAALFVGKAAYPTLPQGTERSDISERTRNTRCCLFPRLSGPRSRPTTSQKI